MKPSHNNDFTQWIVLCIVTVVLGGLLFIKITGRQNIFSYQGIHSDTPGLRTYFSGVTTINGWLKGMNATESLQEGIQTLQRAYTITKNKELLSMLSGEISKAKSLDLIQTTTTCFDALQSGFVTMRGILHEYETLTSGFAAVQSGFQYAIAQLPASTTKQCLISYKENLQHSLDSLILTYKNIDLIAQQYDEEVVAYTKKLGPCTSRQESFVRMNLLYNKLKTVNTAIATVQTYLEAGSIPQYNELCSYGTIAGLTGLQTESRKLLQALGSSTTAPSFQQVDNVQQYLDTLYEQSETVTGQVSWWQRVLGPYFDDE